MIKKSFVNLQTRSTLRRHIRCETYVCLSAGAAFELLAIFVSSR